VSVSDTRKSFLENPREINNKNNSKNNSRNNSIIESESKIQRMSFLKPDRQNCTNDSFYPSKLETSKNSRLSSRYYSRDLTLNKPEEPILKELEEEGTKKALDPPFKFKSRDKNTQ
jgi:hypothetical protein